MNKKSDFYFKVYLLDDPEHDPIIAVCSGIVTDSKEQHRLLLEAIEEMGLKKIPPLTIENTRVEKFDDNEELEKFLNHVTNADRVCVVCPMCFFNRRKGTSGIETAMLASLEQASKIEASLCKNHTLPKNMMYMVQLDKHEVETTKEMLFAATEMEVVNKQLIGLILEENLEGDQTAISMCTHMYPALFKAYGQSLEAAKKIWKAAPEDINLGTMITMATQLSIQVAHYKEEAGKGIDTHKRINTPDFNQSKTTH